MMSIPKVWRVGDTAAVKLRAAAVSIVCGRIGEIAKDPKGIRRGLFARLELGSPQRIEIDGPHVRELWAPLGELKLPIEVLP